MTFFGIGIRGFLMGAADVIPGVSGGTIAFVTGIYDRLLKALTRFDRVFLKLFFSGRLISAFSHVDLAFLISLLAGMLSAILFFTRVVPLHHYLVSEPEKVFGLFFGLVAASIFSLFLESHDSKKWHYLFMVPGYFFLELLYHHLPHQTPSDPLFLFLYGFVAISAMILPGISGSFILLLLGQYSIILGAIEHFQYLLLLPFAAGCVVGLLSFTRFLSWVLSRFYFPVFFFILGLLINSLKIIWPFQTRYYEVVRGKEQLVRSIPYWPQEWNHNIAWATALALVGAILVLLIHELGKRKKITV